MAAETVCDALTLRSAPQYGRALRRRPARRELDEERRALRTHFAKSFGRSQHDDKEAVQRDEQVRAAFNSPFWPFVLSSTSIGQEDTWISMPTAMRSCIGICLQTRWISSSARVGSIAIRGMRSARTSRVALLRRFWGARMANFFLGGTSCLRRHDRVRPAKTPPGLCPIGSIRLPRSCDRTACPGAAFDARSGATGGATPVTGGIPDGIRSTAARRPFGAPAFKSSARPDGYAVPGPFFDLSSTNRCDALQVAARSSRFLASPRTVIRLVAKRCSSWTHCATFVPGLFWEQGMKSKHEHGGYSNLAIR